MEESCLQDGGTWGEQEYEAAADDLGATLSPWLEMYGVERNNRDGHAALEDSSG